MDEMWMKSVGGSTGSASGTSVAYTTCADPGHGRISNGCRADGILARHRRTQRGNVSLNQGACRRSVVRRILSNTKRGLFALLSAGELGGHGHEPKIARFRNPNSRWAHPWEPAAASGES